MITFERKGRIIDKGLLGKDEIPTLIIKDVNNKTFKVPIPSGADLEEDFKINDELKITYAPINRSLYEEPTKASAPKPVTENRAQEFLPFCSHGVLQDSYGNSDSCADCENPTCGFPKPITQAEHEAIQEPVEAAPKQEVPPESIG